MDFNLSEELVAVRNLAREFAEKEIQPNAVKDDQEHFFRRELVTRMGELGFFGCVIPEEYGGADLGWMALALISEEIARIHSAIRVHINMQMGPSLALLRFGTEAQKKKWIPPLVTGEILGCFAITEPNAGSDVAAMAATAKKNKQGYVLQGTKTWISNAPVADVALVYAYTDRSQRHQGMSAFIVELNKDRVGRRTLEKLGAHASPTGELTFDGVNVPTEQRIGPEGEGFSICMWQLNQTRLNCAAGALGVARAAREAAVSYANQREQFGEKIGRYQMIQDQIAQMVMEEEAARLLVHRAAWLADENKSNNLEVSMGKFAAAEAAAHAADSALKILGAYGYSTEFPVERYLRDAKSYQIVEGSSNIQKLIIGQDALGYRKANR